MEKFSVLLCDKDSSYIRAVVRFLVTSQKQISVAAFTEEEAFQKATGDYDLALLGEEFLHLYVENQTEVRIKQILFLSSKAGERMESHETFYKFQNMTALLEKICTMNMRKKTDHAGEVAKKTAIYSPIYHDLRLPFALTYAHICSAERKVLFLDLENFSPLSDLITSESAKKDLYDVIYLMESYRGEAFDITPFIFTYEGIGMLPTFQNPENIAEITEEQWSNLFNCIEQSGYTLVVLFEQLLQGSEELLSDFDDVILLGRPEDYFLPAQQKCMDLLQNMMQAPVVHEVKLNMSAYGLVEGTYSLRHLMEGNLGSFVRNEFKRTAAFSNP